MATPAESDLPPVLRPEPPPPTLLEQGCTFVTFAVHTFLVDLVPIGETPLRDLLPMFKRLEPYDKATEMGQLAGDAAAAAWGGVELIAGLGIGLGVIGVEGGLAVVGGPVLAAVGLPVTALPALVASGLVVHGGLTMAVAGSHLMQPPKYLNKNQGQGGESAPPKQSSAPSVSRQVNKAGAEYPTLKDPNGNPIPFPEARLERAPKADRVSWGLKERGEFIAEWHRRGNRTPPGGWKDYDIHHIKPREFGGSNAFENLTPVKRTDHQLFNRFWENY